MPVVLPTACQKFKTLIINAYIFGTDTKPSTKWTQIPTYGIYKEGGQALSEMKTH
jgi:hypothetical protein